ncbi:MAG: trehalase family glycosidase, partial [Candidatus Hinthialibacter sp.]
MKLIVGFLFAASVCLTGSSFSEDAPGAIQTVHDAVSQLKKSSTRMIRDSRREMTNGMAAFPPQVGAGYEAFWLRDYEYMLEGNIDAFTDRELTDACRFFIKGIRSDGAAVDCIQFNGSPIYKPGFDSLGENPVADGSPFTVKVAWHTYQKTRDKQLLLEIIDSLIKTMQVCPRNPQTGLVFIDPEKEYDRCPYGFTDTVQKTGDVLFCSLLFAEASNHLASLLEELGRMEEAVHWRKEAQRVSNKILEVFWDEETGLFRAATVQCREHDIWGSAFAVYLGVADGRRARKIAQYFKDHYGEIVQRGQLRHTPGGVYWEVARTRDQYQNGGYWATPMGWFIYTLNRVDPQLADQTIIDLA